MQIRIILKILCTWYNKTLLKAEAREAISINSFRKNIFVEIVNPPSYYAFGNRFINIIHTKLRHKCILHYDLYKRNISDTPFCSCGQNEDVYQLFFVCKNYYNAETICLIIYKFTHGVVNIDTNLLLCGDIHLPLQTNININIFSVVLNFIVESNRFT